MIELIAEKQVATAAIQGKFSVEGISAMAEGVDARVALASSLADQDVKSEVPCKRCLMCSTALTNRLSRM